MGQKRLLFNPVLAVCLVASALLLCAPSAHAQSNGKLIFPDETDPQVLEWGRVTVEDFLALHQLPSSEVESIKTYARQDLRDNLRAFAWTKLQLLIKDTRSTLDPVESRMLSRFGEMVKVIGTEALKTAVDEKNLFQSNRCIWKPDADLAKATGFSWDGAYHCPRSPYSPVFDISPPIPPTKDFFLAFGQKKSWIEKIAIRPGGLRSIAHISAAGTLHLAIGISAALILGIVLPSIGASMKFFKYLLIKTVQEAGEVVGIQLEWLSRGAGFWVGVGISIAIAIALITITAFLYTEGNRIESEYSQLDTQYSDFLNTPALDRPQLVTFISTENGRLALYSAFLRLSVPVSTPPTPAALPSPAADDPVFSVRVPGSPSGTPASSITFPGWDGERTRARLWRGWFLQEALVALPSVDLTSLNSRIRFLWNGKKYEASRIGSAFAVKKAIAEPTDTACTIDRATGVTLATDLTKCDSFVTRNLEMDLEGVGKRIVSVSQAVSFISAATAKVSMGSPFEIPIAATGLPEPVITAVGALPSGFTLAPGSLLGTATLQWAGSGAPLGTQTISLRADNGVEVKTMTLQVEVTDKVNFTSPTQTSFTFETGQFVTIPIVATGYPVPTVTLTNQSGLTCGLRLVQIASHEYKLSGYVQPPPSPFRCFLQFEARNSFEIDNTKVVAYLDLTIDATPPAAQPYLVTSEIATPAGLPRQYLIETAGTTAPVNITITTDAQGLQRAPGWVSLRDLGNGSAVLSVTPPMDAPDIVAIPLWYRVAGTLGNMVAGANDGVTLRVRRAPLFAWTGGSSTSRFDVGSLVDQYWGAQAQSANGNVTFQFDPPLPPGLQYRTGTYGAFEIYGRATQEGEYNLNVTATNAYESTTEPIRILVAKAAKIDSPNVVNFYVGRSNRFEVTASGFPRGPVGNPSKFIPEPMSFSHVSQWVFDLLGLRFDTRDPVTQEQIFGRAIISGTPSATGRYPVELSAKTAGLPSNSQQLVIVATNYGDVNGDFNVDCQDVAFVTSRIGRRRGMSGYDYNADIVQDGVIDVRDLAAVSSRLPVGTRCQ